MYRPWHVRTVAIIACLVTLVAAVGYLLTQYRLDAWFALLDPRAVRYAKGLPDLVELAWAVSVWAGVAGAFFLLGNRRNAAALLAIAALAAMVLAVWLIFLEPVTVLAAFGLPGAALVCGWAVILLAVWLYARAMHAQGVIR